GMGSDLKESNPDLYAKYLAKADEISGAPIQQYSLEGPAESLTETNIAQPALFALSLAVAEAATDAGIRPDFVAGHSLGEYTAAVASGAVAFEDGVRLVALRGKLMNESQTERPGTMAAVIGLERERLEELCRSASEAGLVAPANPNTPATRCARRSWRRSRARFAGSSARGASPRPAARPISSLVPAVCSAGSRNRRSAWRPTRPRPIRPSGSTLFSRPTPRLSTERHR